MNIIDLVNNHLDDMLTMYSQGEFYHVMSQASQEYFTMTGQVQDEDEDYDSRWNSFYLWYLFHYKNHRFDKNISELYFSKLSNDNEVKTMFGTLNYSLFEFHKRNFKKEIVLKDILHNTSIVLDQKENDIGIVVKDVFLAHTLTMGKKGILLKGISLLPREVKSRLKSESKKIRKQEDPSFELSFLIGLESLRSKWMRYGHVDPYKIFSF